MMWCTRLKWTETTIHGGLLLRLCWPSLVHLRPEISLRTGSTTFHNEKCVRYFVTCIQIHSLLPTALYMKLLMWSTRHTFYNSLVWTWWLYRMLLQFYFDFIGFFGCRRRRAENAVGRAGFHSDTKFGSSLADVAPLTNWSTIKLRAIHVCMKDLISSTSALQVWLLRNNS